MSYRINAYPVDLLGKRDLEIVGIADSNLAEREAARLRGEIDASGKLVYRQVVVAAEVIDGGHERWASTLSIAIRTLRKLGFYVAQDPDAAKQSDDAQKRQALEAECVLLNLPASPENVGHQVVEDLGRELLENASVAAERLRGRI
ncbi:hypothetical protein SAMN03159335_06205 [Burkholderia cepacia]|uniref:hypothetical protein n=1 Tax=Burkholderia cepacia TaxID=292 RepID=UPI0008D272D8|nr:hypothetical protein [Burkholderia cepacia]SEU40138.1 hypothetical protein SAMN03159335_06205 [Burkholderia cepacia]